MGNDDFFNANQDQCDSLSTVLYYNKLLPFLSGLSMLCYLYIFYMYYVIRVPILRRHPTTLAIYKCILECIFVQQYLWLPFMPNEMFYRHGDTVAIGDKTCHGSTLAAGLAFVTQFSLLGGELWFLAISWDLRLAYTNPFSSYKQNKMFFMASIFLVATVMAVVLAVLPSSVYGVASEGVVWINSVSSSNINLPNYYKLFFFYFWMVAIYFFCLVTNYQLSQKIKKGLVETLSIRLSIIKRARVYVAGYTFFWGVLLFLEFMSFILPNDFDSLSITTAVAYIYAGRGIWSLGVIIYTNWADISWTTMSPFGQRYQRQLVENVVQEGLSLQPHLNSALRAEILYFCTQGIMFAAKECQRHLRQSQVSHGPGGPVAQGQGKDSDNDYSFKDKMPLRSSVAVQGLHQGGGEGQDLDIRDPSVDIAKIHDAQQNMIARTIRSAAYLEAKDMGIHGVEVTDDLPPSGSTADSTGNPLLQSNPYLQKTKSSELGLNIHPSSQHNSALSSGSGHDIERDDDAAGQVERESCSSISSAATVKWRDTMDIEFTMGHPNQSHLKSLDKDSRWRRIKKNSTSSAATSRFLGFSDDSDFPASNSLRTPIIAMSTAISQATEVAIATLNGTYDEFRFKDFNPLLFSRIRVMCNIDEFDYAQAFETTTKEMFSEGRSGAFLFFSADQKYLVKTTTKGEIQTLQRILKPYVDYLSVNPHSLITRFLGAHCITMYGQEIYFVVMKSVFPASATISERYDLKGSWVNRHSLAGSKMTRSERLERDYELTSPLYLDNDVQQKIVLDPVVANALAEQIRRDVSFLRDQQLMDYSLLVGVKRQRFEVITTAPEHEQDTMRASAANMRMSSPSYSHNPRGSVSLQAPVRNALPPSEIVIDPDNPFQCDSQGGLRAGVIEGPGVYFIGIIDILQEWDWKKKMERFLKMNFMFLDGEGLSSIEPIKYCNRFYDRCVYDIFDGLELDVSYFVPKRRTYQRDSPSIDSSASFSLVSTGLTVKNIQNSPSPMKVHAQGCNAVDLEDGAGNLSMVGTSGSQQENSGNSVRLIRPTTPNGSSSTPVATVA